jgi:hypothetical protein
MNDPDQALASERDPDPRADPGIVESILRRQVVEQTAQRGIESDPQNFWSRHRHTLKVVHSACG